MRYGLLENLAIIHLCQGMRLFTAVHNFCFWPRRVQTRHSVDQCAYHRSVDQCAYHRSVDQCAYHHSVISVHTVALWISVHTIALWISVHTIALWISVHTIALWISVHTITKFWLKLRCYWLQCKDQGSNLRKHHQGKSTAWRLQFTYTQTRSHTYTDIWGLGAFTEREIINPPLPPPIPPHTPSTQKT